MRFQSRPTIGLVLLAGVFACKSDATSPDTNGGNPTLSVSLSPASISVAQGANGSVGITLTRGGGFSGAVTLSVEEVPAGVTATASPASVAAGSTTATLSLSVGGAVTAGSHSLKVRAKGSGVSDATATLSLTVTATQSSNEVWTFCPAAGIPVWFAYQDGSGSWTPVTGTANAYEFSINSGKGGVAYVIGTGTEYAMNVQFGTAQELMQLGAALCANGTGTKTVMGNVLNLGITEQAFVTFGTATAVVFGGSNGFTLQNVVDGARDLIAGRVALGVGGGSVTYTMNAGAIMRGINPANGSTITVDFAGAQSFTPVMHNLSINNLGSDMGQVSATYITAGGSTGTLYTDGGGSNQTARQYAGVPASVQQSGDLHQLTVSAFGTAGSPTTFRTTSKLFATAADETLTLGPDLGAVTMTIAATAPYVRPRVQYSTQNEYNRFWSGGWSQSANGISRSAVLTVSGGYLGGGTGFDFTLPDFSGVAGWNNLWGFVTGSDLGWQFFGAGWTQPGGYGGVPALNGALSMAATRIGTIVP